MCRGMILISDHGEDLRMQRGKEECPGGERGMDFKNLEAYELIEDRRIDDLASEAVLLRHKKTGAKIALLSNEEENKVFYISFRTPPTDSTGVAHIIEHTVLCGSRDFPVKDPFMELVKGSLNTFLNAITYPDKTIYPVASCNDADFKNLMHVYLDAVFYPNIYLSDKYFKQEGWHYEMESPEDELKINGVVYNEMKGAYSSPEDVLARAIQNSLYPDNAYGVESGGDPDHIPDLTYEQYLDFHKRYYHPSNSYIYLYGNMDMEERLRYLDEAYLSHFDYLPIDSQVKDQAAFSSPRETTLPYSILQADSLSHHTYLTYNCSLETTLDAELYLAMNVLDYALISSPGAVLKQALLNAGIGQDISANYESAVKQPYYSITASYAEKEQKDDFVRVIREVLQEQVRQGIDKKALLAGINQGEFHFREANFGRVPKGLIYGLQMLESWLYDETKPWLLIDAGKHYQSLREKLDSGYFEALIQKYLLDNPHRTVLMMVPERGLSARKEKELADSLQNRKKNLSSAEVDQIIKDLKELRKWQETPDREEDLLKIPMLQREDLRKEAEPFFNQMKKLGEMNVLRHDVFTTGIAYLRLIFDTEHVPQELFPYLIILKAALGLVDTKEHSYTELNREIDIYTGGIGASTGIYTDAKNEKKYLTTFEVSLRVLYENLEKGVLLVQEILTSSLFQDRKRMREILEELKSNMKSVLTSAGHQAAASRALSHVSEQGRISDLLHGIAGFRLVESLCENDEEGQYRDLARKLDALCRILFRKENLLIDYTSPEEAFAPLEKALSGFDDHLFQEAVTEGHFTPGVLSCSEAFETAGSVQYVCRAGNFRHAGLPYTGVLRLLKVMMGYDYLWNQIRVKGGAYGCMTNFGRSGDSYFVTYRDPHLKQSVDVFAGAAAYIAGFEADDRTMTKYVIGAVGESDVPKTPPEKGVYGLTMFLTGTTMEMLQKSRDELLHASVEDVRALAPYAEALMKEGAFCVIGAQEKIRSHQEMFDETMPLFSQSREEEEQG